MLVATVSYRGLILFLSWFTDTPRLCARLKAGLEPMRLDSAMSISTERMAKTKKTDHTYDTESGEYVLLATCKLAVPFNMRSTTRLHL